MLFYSILSIITLCITFQGWGSGDGYNNVRVCGVLLVNILFLNIRRQNALGRQSVQAKAAHVHFFDGSSLE